MFLLCGYELEKIQESVGVSRKSMHAIKSKILRRLDLKSKQELCALLRLCEFVEFYEKSVHQRADWAEQPGEMRQISSAPGNRNRPPMSGKRVPVTGY